MNDRGISKYVIDGLPGGPRESMVRDRWLKISLIIATAILIGRSFYLQVWEGREHQLMAENNRVTKVALTAPRGLIFDRQGKQLVENIASTDVVFDPALLPPEENEAILIDSLPNLIDVSPEEIRVAITETRQKQRVTPIKKALSHEQVIALEGKVKNLPGVRLMSNSVRKYPFAHAAGPFLGYTGPVTAEELAGEASLLPTDFSGKSGLERYYEGRLKGVHGAAYVEVDADMRIIKEVRQDDSTAGDDLKLTIDIELQEVIFNLLAERVEKPLAGDPLGQNPTGAAVVALDPRSGEVLALVSYPSYDPNAFSQPGKKADADESLRDTRQPLFNRALSGTYPPGSTIKPILAAAGLEEGIFTKDTKVNSAGGINIGQWSFPDWQAGGHGMTDVYKALAESVNTYFYLLVGGDENKAGMGARKAVGYLADFGWGEVTGVDLPGEASGFLPTPEWKQKAKGERWYIGDDYHLGIGQGDVLVTPLQIAASTAIIANGGSYLRPHFYVENAKDDYLIRTVDINNHHLKTVAAGMRQAVTDGSGRSLLSVPIEIAGKTGTAQTGREDVYHAWFTSYAPYAEPELVLTVLVEEGGGGDKNAVPIAKEIWQWWVEKRR